MSSPSAVCRLPSAVCRLPSAVCRPGTPIINSMQLAPGSRLAHYDISSLLGKGGMGEVWRARDTKLGRDVAIKVLPEEFTRDAERLARFEREARVLASLNHPGIASIYGLEHVDEVQLLVMELAEGEDLSVRLQRGPIPTGEAIGMARRMAEAIEAAHEKGIVHRDLKPGNIKVGPEGEITILDFGLAKALATDEPEDDLSNSPTLVKAATQAGMILGTAAYMSPEQASGRRVDKRTDIWAFGVVLFEMLTGARLFRGETISETLASVIKDEPRYDLLPAGTPRLVRRLLERCLTRNPKQRLRDIGEARIALASAGDEEQATVAVVPASPGVLVGIGALAVVLVIAAGYLGWALKPTPPAEPARKLDLVASGVEAQWFTAPILSPDGSHIAYLAGGAIWVRNLSRVDGRRLVELHDSLPPSLFWSPDGRHLGYNSVKKLWKIDVTSGTSVAICDLPKTGFMVGAAWKSDGTIAIASWRDGMYAVPAQGGVPQLLFPAEAGNEIDFHFPTFLPDGRLLFAAHIDTRAEGVLPGAAESEKYELGTWNGTERMPVGLLKDEAFDWATYEPGSEHLLFVRRMPNLGIWAVPVDLATLVPRGDAFMVAAGAASLSVAANGSILYVETASLEGVNELIWTDRKGDFLSVIAEAQQGMVGPAISPDGSKLAVSAIVGENRDIWICDLERGTQSRLTFEDLSESAPAWFPDSRRIIYDESIGMRSRVVERNADGSGERREVLEPRGYGLWMGLSAVAPEGGSLLYGVDDKGRVGLRMVRLRPEGGTDGEGEPIFKGVEPNTIDARISPDGRLLAYVTDETGRPEVFLTRFPSGEGRWQVSTSGGRMPRWARETGELFFIGGAGPTGRTMMVSRITSSPEVAVGSPETLFVPERAAAVTLGDVGFDVSSDGQRFALLRAGRQSSGPTRRMVLVDNWFEEFAGR